MRNYWPVERIMNDFFGGNTPWPRQWFHRAGTSVLRAHWDEKDGNYVITAEVPGLTKDNLSLSYKEDYLTLKASYGEERDGVLRSGEYSYCGYFPGADISKVDAQLKSGILTITLPKTPEETPVTIDIKSE
jgi:HSP20 family protein